MKLLSPSATATSSLPSSAFLPSHSNGLFHLTLSQSLSPLFPFLWFFIVLQGSKIWAFLQLPSNSLRIRFFTSPIRTLHLNFIHFYSILLSSIQLMFSYPNITYKFTSSIFQGRCIRKAGSTNITAKFELKPPPYPLVRSKFSQYRAVSLRPARPTTAQGPKFVMLKLYINK